MTNAYNFMDGIDGIAGSQAVVAAGTAASMAFWQGEFGFALFAAVLAGGVAGFLLHNWPPARIFMGDVGSAFLGYTFAGLAVLSGNGSGGGLPFAVWLILLGPFLFDSALTLVLRIARGERWYEPHRQHLYQRLVRQGWSHLAVTSVYVCADLFLAGVAVACFTMGLGFTAVAVLTAAPLLGIVGLVKWVEAKS
ncbi:MAG: glycosyl transferase family 4, partial [Actinobacteria bacterium]|nr:glycosyl transferase family 4 [Actinomycetota bacterium]